MLRFRKPSLLVHIRDESPGPASNSPGEEMTAGEVNELIMQSLLEQGRLRLDQLVNSVANKLDKPIDQIRELLQRHFFGLVKVGHAHHCCFPVCSSTRATSTACCSTQSPLSIKSIVDRHSLIDWLSFSISGVAWTLLQLCKGHTFTPPQICHWFQEVDEGLVKCQQCSKDISCPASDSRVSTLWRPWPTPLISQICFAPFLKSVMPAELPCHAYLPACTTSIRMWSYRVGT